GKLNVNSIFFKDDINDIMKGIEAVIKLIITIFTLSFNKSQILSLNSLIILSMPYPQSVPKPQFICSFLYYIVCNKRPQRNGGVRMTKSLPFTKDQIAQANSINLIEFVKSQGYILENGGRRALH